MQSLFIFIFCFSFSATAELDSSSQEALEKTQELMLNTEKRNEIQKNEPKSQAVDKKIDLLTNDPQTKQHIYELSAQVLKNLASKANGDVKEMEKIIEEAQENPEAFYNNMFNDSQKTEVRGLANEIEKSKSPVSSGQK